MTDLYRRFIGSSILITVVACLITFAFLPAFQYVVTALVALMAGVAMWEYEQFAKAKGGKMVTPVLIILSMAEVVAFFLWAKSAVLQSLPLAVFFIGFLILFAIHFKENEGAIVNLAISSFGLLYIAVPVGMILGILYSKNGDGRWWLAYLLVVTKITDIGAYFGGSLWGKRKLAPSISPKKTVEGAIWGLVCAILASLAFYFISNSVSSYEWLVLGLILGIVGQFGDLSESLLKRDAKKKDSNALPGLGGMLDLMDSILFNVIIIFIYINFIKV